MALLRTAAAALGRKRNSNSTEGGSQGCSGAVVESENGGGGARGSECGGCECSSGGAVVRRGDRQWGREGASGGAGPAWRRRPWYAGGPGPGPLAAAGLARAGAAPVGGALGGVGHGAPCRGPSACPAATRPSRPQPSPRAATPCSRPPPRSQPLRRRSWPTMPPSSSSTPPRYNPGPGTLLGYQSLCRSAQRPPRMTPSQPAPFTLRKLCSSVSASHCAKVLSDLRVLSLSETSGELLLFLCLCSYCGAAVALAVAELLFLWRCCGCCSSGAAVAQVLGSLDILFEPDGAGAQPAGGAGGPMEECPWRAGQGGGRGGAGGSVYGVGKGSLSLDAPPGELDGELGVGVWGPRWRASWPPRAWPGCSAPPAQGRAPLAAPPERPAAAWLRTASARRSPPPSLPTTTATTGTSKQAAADSNAASSGASTTTILNSSSSSSRLSSSGRSRNPGLDGTAGSPRGGTSDGGLGHRQPLLREARTAKEGVPEVYHRDSSSTLALDGADAAKGRPSKRDVRVLDGGEGEGAPASHPLSDTPQGHSDVGGGDQEAAAREQLQRAQEEVPCGAGAGQSAAAHAPDGTAWGRDCTT